MKKSLLILAIGLMCASNVFAKAHVSVHGAPVVSILAEGQKTCESKLRKLKEKVSKAGKLILVEEKCTEGPQGYYASLTFY